MIISLDRFVAAEEPYWAELASLLDRLAADPAAALSLDEARRFHYLYQRVASDLAQVASFAGEPGLRQRLESLVARAYAEIHETRRRTGRIHPLRWARRDFPQTFRRHGRAFLVLTAAVVLGAAFGAFIIRDNPRLKQIVLPFSHLQMNPADRVAREESDPREISGIQAATFSEFLMTHNIQVAVFSFALGMTFGLGTLILEFYNGVIMGAVACDYILAGQGKFLAGWLLPHGAIEIPAFMIAGQAGLVLAWALLGWGNALPLRRRLALVRADVVTLVLGTAMLLVWAGIVEAFFSQYHEPTVPYPLKIAFGLVEFAALIAYLSLAGRKQDDRR